MGSSFSLRSRIQKTSSSAPLTSGAARRNSKAERTLCRSCRQGQDVTASKKKHVCNFAATSPSVDMDIIFDELDPKYPRFWSTTLTAVGRPMTFDLALRLAAGIRRCRSPVLQFLLLSFRQRRRKILKKKNYGTRVQNSALPLF
jgi:hypothetical protein